MRSAQTYLWYMTSLSMDASPKLENSSSEAQTFSQLGRFKINFPSQNRKSAYLTTWANILHDRYDVISPNEKVNLSTIVLDRARHPPNDQCTKSQRTYRSHGRTTICKIAPSSKYGVSLLKKIKFKAILLCNKDSLHLH